MELALLEDPEERRLGDLHWHAYVRSGQPGVGSAAFRSVPALPVRVFARPGEAVGWITEMTRRHAHRAPIRLLGGSGWATLADADQLRVDEGANLAVLNRGHSLRIDFPRAHDRMHLWVEAVTALECPEVHDVPR